MSLEAWRIKVSTKDIKMPNLTKSQSFIMCVCVFNILLLLLVFQSSCPVSIVEMLDYCVA